MLNKRSARTDPSLWDAISQDVVTCFVVHNRWWGWSYDCRQAPWWMIPLAGLHDQNKGGFFSANQSPLKTFQIALIGW